MIPDSLISHLLFTFHSLDFTIRNLLVTPHYSHFMFHSLPFTLHDSLLFIDSLLFTIPTLFFTLYSSLPLVPLDSLLHLYEVYICQVPGRLKVFLCDPPDSLGHLPGTVQCCIHTVKYSAVMCTYSEVHCSNVYIQLSTVQSCVHTVKYSAVQ